MADPISGAGGGAAKLALQQLQQMQQTQQAPKPSVNPAGGGSNFANKMQTQQLQQSQQVNEAQRVNQSIRPQKVRSTNMQNQTQRVQGTQKGEASRFGKTNTNSGMSSGIANFVKSVNNRKSSLDQMMKQALNGKSFNNKELLVLQYKVSQFSMEMDLTSKVVDKTTGGIKQAMNTQV